MQLIADAGSTKTQWYLCHNNEVLAEYKTSGCNPSTMPNAVIQQSLDNLVLPIDKAQVQAVYFYGAGCGSAAAQKTMQTLLECHFEGAKGNVVVQTDLYAAALACSGDAAAICCILGTGSNSCVFVGRQIVAQVPSLGYLLGDEGGGVDLGKRLIQSYFYGQMPKDLQQKFEEAFPTLNREVLVAQLYQQPNPNTYLAGFVPFMQKNNEHLFVKQLIQRTFVHFFNQHLEYYSSYKNLPISFVGSIAWVFAAELHEAAQIINKKINKILSSPFPELLNFCIK